MNPIVLALMCGATGLVAVFALVCTYVLLDFAAEKVAKAIRDAMRP